MKPLFMSSYFVKKSAPKRKYRKRQHFFNYEWLDEETSNVVEKKIKDCVKALEEISSKLRFARKTNKKNRRNVWHILMKYSHRCCSS